MLFPCAPINRQIQMLYVKSSLVPTTLDPVETILFSFFLMDLQCNIAYPNYIQPPVWIFRSGCNPYATLTHVHNWLSLSDPMIILSLIVCFRYFNTCLNLTLSSLVLLVTMVHIKYIAGSMLVLLLFSTHSSLANIECRMSTSLLSSLVELS